MTRAVMLAALALATAPGAAHAAEEVGTTFPPGFPVPIDHQLDKPVIGFGAAGEVRRTPVVVLHGNNDAPYATGCNTPGHIHEFAQYFLEHGYRPAELWALGYEGDQCDLITSPANRSSEAHSTVANVADLRDFVRAVLRYTGARQVDVVGHSLGVTLTREWLRRDGAYGLVRALIAVDGPNHGIINCSPSPQNFYALPASGGFDPDSALCLEYGSDHTPLLRALNGSGETPGPTGYLAIVNADTSFVYFAKQDGAFPPVPAEDREGMPHDFSRSARLDGVTTVELTEQGRYDETVGSAHLGIVNSPETWRLAWSALEDLDRTAAVPSAAPVPAAATAPAAATPPARVRVRPRMSARVRRARGRRYVTTGRVTPPAGIADACGRGTVVVQVKAARRTISTRRTRLGAGCRFSSAVRFRHRVRGRPSFSVRFGGNDVLTPAAVRVR